MSSMDPYSPPEVTSILINAGSKKAEQRYYMTFCKALLGGWMIGFGANLVHVMHGTGGVLEEQAPVITGFLAALFFPIALLMILMTGMELITANLMSLPMAALNGRIRVWEIPVNWILVFFGNLCGVLIYIELLEQCAEAYPPSTIKFAVSLAEKKVALGFGVVLLRGVGCNFLVAMGVWLATSAREMGSKIIAMYLPAGLFVFLGYEHVAANMYFIPVGMMYGAKISAAKYIRESVIPSFIGNMIGGMLLGVPMVLIYHPPPLPSFITRNSSESSLATLSEAPTRTRSRVAEVGPMPDVHINQSTNKEFSEENANKV